MTKHYLFLVAWAVLSAGAFPAVAQSSDAPPPISIDSPDHGDTYPESSIKSESLNWDKKKQLLTATVVFIPGNMATGFAAAQDDSHSFSLPGVQFDEAHNIFVAPAADGTLIPVAKFKKILFLKEIIVTPNANIRVMRAHGAISVRLEAIRLNDPALKAPPENHDGTQSVPINKLF